MNKDTQLRTKQTEVIRDLKILSNELTSIKGIMTSGVVSSEILKVDEALHSNLDKLHSICDFIIEFYNSTEPAKITEMKDDIRHLREKNAADQGTIYNLKKEIADLRQESLENKTKIEKADSALDAFKDPEGLVKSMDIFYEVLMENEDLAREFFELDESSGEKGLHKKVSYAAKLLDNVLVKGIDYGKKLAEKFDEYNKDIGKITRRATDEKSRADKLAEELKSRVSSLEKMKQDYEKAQEDIDVLQRQDQEHRETISGLNAGKDNLENELVQEKEKSASLSSQLQSEIDNREIAEKYLERLGIAYETLREVVPSEVMAAIDDALKSDDEGTEELVQELLLGSIVGKEELETAKKKYGTLQEALKAIFGDELLAEYEGLTEEQNPYLWLMQTHQDLFVEKAKSDEQLEKAARDLQSAVQEHLALEQGVIHAVSLLTENPDIEKIKEHAVDYLKEKIEELKQEKDEYEGKMVDLEGQVEEKDESLRKQEEESSGQKEMYDGKIKELEVQVQDKEAALKRQEEESARQNEDYDGRVQELESQVQEKEDALTKLKENYAGTEDDMQAEISRLNQKNKELEAEKKAMGEEFEEPEISSNALLLKADMQYMLANDYMNENATDTAKIYLAAAMTLCKQALDRSDEEEKGLIQEKINGYQDTLKMLEEQ